MKKRIFVLSVMALSMLFLSGCGYIKSEMKASKAKKNLDGEEFKKYYLLSLFGTHSEVKEYLLREEGTPRDSYLKEFWMMYDNDLSSTRNSFYSQVLKRYSYAKLKFNYMRRSGEKTDMGRMYIVYGPPVDILRNPQEVDREDFQEVIVWEYEDPKMFSIGFKDENGTGNYTLIPNFESIPTITGSGFRKRNIEEVREWRYNNEKNF